VYKGTPLPTITEHPFDITMGNYKGEPVIFTGVIDELYEHESKKEYFTHIGEHKTFSMKPNMNTLVMNTQKCLYAKAVQKIYGILPPAVIWDYIKSTPAKQPIWLEKSHRFSSSKSQDITPYSWMRACNERGICDEEVISKGELYKDNIANFFFRVPMDMQEEMVDNVWDGFVYTSKQIVKQGHKNTTKNMTKDCAWCSFQPICHAEMTGGDVAYTIKKDYQEKEKHN
jgi:hypothetical protein